MPRHHCHGWQAAILPGRLRPHEQSDLRAARNTGRHSDPYDKAPVGAGHGTHLSMLSAKQLTGGKLIVLMKPSLPYSFFDFCIVPEHDSPPIRDNIISTKGAINPVSFNPNKNIGTGLILLGGPSEHFGWDEANIIKQVEAIIKHHKNIKWTIADSPRTPATTLKQMEQLQDADFAPFQQTPTEKLREIVYNSATIWVSADSVSMIYESLSSGARVGVLDVLQKKEGRISNAINTLIQDELVTSFSYWDKTKKLNTHNPAFNEASRIAAQVLNNGTPD